MDSTGTAIFRGAALIVACLVIAVLLLVGFLSGFKSWSRYQKRADAENKVKVTAIQIRNQQQRVKIAQQKAQIRFVESTGIRRAQDEIAKTLTPLYVQFELVEALKTGKHSTIYIPTDPATGLPVVTTRNAVPEGGK
jgi:hypothetical protein